MNKQKRTQSTETDLVPQAMFILLNLSVLCTLLFIFWTLIDLAEQSSGLSKLITGRFLQ